MIKRRFSKLLMKAFEEQIPKVRERVKTLQTKSGDTIVGKYTINQVVQGMKGINGMFYPCSQLDADFGIRFRGLSIPEMDAALPKLGNEMLPEAVFWLLCTGRAPTAEELKDIQTSLNSAQEMPASTKELITRVAKDLHPMTTLSMAILDLQRNSEFAKEYSKGTLKKDKFWIPTYNDSLNILRLLPEIAGLIYRTKFGKSAVPVDAKDWSGRYANHMGFKADAKVLPVLREYLSIHTDHEGGNVSAHTGYLISSALSDAYLSVSGMINGLAGPLHGLANQEVMRFVHAVDAELQKNNVQVTSVDDPKFTAEVEKFIRNWLKTGVVPGYGHGKLRAIDPRFTALKQLSHKLMPRSRLCTIVQGIEKVATPVLKSLGKVKNPYPNVDAHSGVLLYETGLKEFEYYTVVFAVSRAIGVLANIIWARAIGLNIERPGSLTLESLEKIAKDGGKLSSDEE